MLDAETKSRINTARDILVGKVPDPKSQVEQITIALIYKFMDDMDVESEELGGKRTFFVGEYSKYAWRKIFDPRQSGYDLLNLYSEAIGKMDTNPGIPKLFRDIFKNAYLPYRDPETLKSFLKIINEFDYSHSEKLGDAFEFLLSILGSQGDAGQFRTPRHIIDFMVAIIDPKKHEIILDPACGTAGFLISSYKHIIKQNSSNYIPDENPRVAGNGTQSVNEVIITSNGYSGDKLTADERRILADNMHGYDISPDMVRLSLVNMYLHGVKEPQIFEYDTLTSEDHWNEFSDVILANPPFMSPKGGIRPHKRFSVQSNRSEVLFVDYIAEHLTPDGRACVIVPEGIIFQSGKAYKQLRKMLVEKFLVGVISLPAGVFQPYSGVKTSILWLDKSLAKKTDKVLFVKIENDGFDLGAQRRALKGSDLPVASQKISDYKYQISLDKLADFEQNIKISLVERKEIYGNGDYNLSGERYRRVYKISSKYELVELGKVTELYQPQTITSKEIQDTGRYKVFGANGVIGFFDKFNHEEPQVLITCRGATCGTINLSEPYSWITGNAMVSKPINETILSKMYLYYLLKNCDLSIAISGSAQPQITRQSIKLYKIPLPPYSVQVEVVSEVDSFQKIIYGARQVVENYKPRIDIDPEWEMVELGKVVHTFQYGSSKKSLEEGDIPCIRMGNIKNGELIWDDLKYAPINEEVEKYLLNDGDVLFNRTNSAVHVGKTGIFRGNRKAVFAGYLIRLRYDPNKIHGEYLNYCLNSDFARAFYAKVKTDGINQSNINPKSLATFQLALPPMDIQMKIISLLAREQELVYANREIIEIFEQKIKDRIAKVWGE